jgi:hypothetical protein
MPLRFSRKEDEKTLEPLAPIIPIDFEKKLEQWEPITLTLLQNITEVTRKLDGYYELIKEGTVTSAEIRSWLIVHLKLPLETYQKTIYTSYKVFLQNIISEFSKENSPEAFDLARNASSTFNTLKHFDITARLVLSICDNVFKIPGNLTEQFYGLEQVFKTRLPELLKQVARQHEDMHTLIEQYNAVKTLIGEEVGV